MSNQSIKAYFEQGGAASHIQAACALFAVGFAVWANASWQDQEKAKRKADFAIEVLKSTNALADCFAHARTGFAMREDEIAPGAVAITRLSKTEGPKLFADCTTLAATVRAHQTIAKQVLSENVSNELGNLLERHTKLGTMYDMIASHNNDAMLQHIGGLAKWIKSVRWMLDQAGMKYLVVVNGIWDLSHDDEEQDRFNKIRNKIEALLLPYIEFK